MNDLRQRRMDVFLGELYVARIVIDAIGGRLKGENGDAAAQEASALMYEARNLCHRAIGLIQPNNSTPTEVAGKLRQAHHITLGRRKKESPRAGMRGS